MKDNVLKNNIDFSLEFVPPYTKVTRLYDIRLLIIGRDPTVREIESRKKITSTLNLDKAGSSSLRANVL